MAKVPVTALIIDDGCMFKGPNDEVEEAYVATIIDPTKQIFMGIKAADKSPITWSPTDMVTKIEVPGVGAVLKAL